MDGQTYNVLFLCTGNTARSILAEGILRKDGAGRFNAFSAGSQPKGRREPLRAEDARRLRLPRRGFPLEELGRICRARRAQMDFVFTVCDNAAGEVCPFWPGQPMTAHWGIEDPAAVEGSDIDKQRAFNEAFRYLRNRITAFTSLPLQSIGKLALSAQLKEIGRMEGSTSGTKGSSMTETSASLAPSDALQGSRLGLLRAVISRSGLPFASSPALCSAIWRPRFSTRSGPQPWRRSICRSRRLSGS